MDWTAVGVIASGLLAVLAIVVQQVNRRTDRREGAQVAREAADRADRAVQAAERSAAAAEAQAVAIARAAPLPQAAWTLEHHNGDSYLLTNVGNAVAHDVALDTGDMAVRDAHWPRDAIAPSESAKLLAARSLATRDDTVTVTWADEPGGAERRSWRRPLPPKEQPQTPMPRPAGIGTQRGLPRDRP